MNCCIPGTLIETHTHVNMWLTASLHVCVSVCIHDFMFVCLFVFLSPDVFRSRDDIF